MPTAPANEEEMARTKTLRSNQVKERVYSLQDSNCNLRFPLPFYQIESLIQQTTFNQLVTGLPGRSVKDRKARVEFSLITLESLHQDSCVLIRFANSRAAKPVRPSNLTLVFNDTTLMRQSVCCKGKGKETSCIGSVEVSRELLRSVNVLHIGWTDLLVNGQSEEITMCIHCAGYKSVNNIVQELNSQQFSRQESLKRVHQRLSIKNDEIISSDMMTVSLICPLSRKRIKTPVRGVDCQHLDCFDAKDYLILNEAPRSKWYCPRCNRYVPVDQLVVDQLFLDFLDFTQDSAVTIEARGQEIVIRERKKAKSAPFIDILL